jgi:hypothetical protein
MDGSEPTRFSRPIAVLTLLAVSTIYVLRLDRIVGLMGDDGWYVLLAKAMSAGDGYRLISAAATPILPMYPPGFPAALAVVFRLYPQFPDNVWLLKGVSFAAMAILSVLTFRYLVHVRAMRRDLAAGVATATALTPAFVFLATSTIMSECFFAATQLLAVLFVERTIASSGERDRRTYGILAASTAALAFLVRTAGIALLVAVPVYLVARRGYRTGFAFIGVAAVCLGPWLVYAALHQPSLRDRLAQGGQIALPYADHFWRRADGSGPVDVRELPARIQQNIWNIVSRDVGGLVVPQLYRGPTESGQEVLDLAPPAAGRTRSMGNTLGTVVVSCVIAAVLVGGFVRTVRQRVTVAELLVPLSIAITVLWPFPTFRFVLPLLPFLFFYFVAAISGFRSVLVARAALLSVIGLQALDHAGYISAAHHLAGDAPIYFDQQFDDVETVLGWMRDNLHEDGAVATDRPALVYLHTGRKTVAIDHANDNWESWKGLGVKYVVALTPGELPDPSHRYRTRFQSPGGRWVVEM